MIVTGTERRQDDCERQRGRTPHICFVMPYHISEGGGGAEVQAWLLAKELAKRGFRISYLAESVSGKAGSVEVREGISIHWLRHFTHFKWLNLLQYYRGLQAIAPDLIVQRMSSFETGIAALYAKAHEKTFVWICTGDAVPVRWRCTRLQWRDNKISNRSYLKKFLLLLNSFVYDVSFQHGIKHAGLLFVQNDTQARLLREHYGRASLRIRSGHEVPKAQHMARTRWQKRSVLWVANLSPNKQPERFIELASLLELDNICCFMVGSRQDENYLARLFAIVPRNLKWLGQIPYEETLELFNSASIVVNTSLSEGFPNTFVQAWLRGVPIVTLGVDPDRIVSENRLGYVGTSVEAIAGVIRTLLNDADRYLTESEHILSYALRNFTIEGVADEFLCCLATENVITECASGREVAQTTQPFRQRL
jgi:glycosyltransferase involved in cell wall biosynthesis